MNKFEQDRVEAAKVAHEFNTRVGRVMLAVAVDAIPSVEELRRLNTRGWLLAAELFYAARGRRPTHGETIRLGKQLRDNPDVQSQKCGPKTLWKLEGATLDAADTWTEAWSGPDAPKFDTP